jgi:hypothetical protein
MKYYLLIVVVFAVSSCNSKHDKKVFLDFKLGASWEEYKRIKDSLIRANALEEIYIGNKKELFYKFGLPDNSSVSSLITPRLDVDRLYSIWIELGNAYDYKFYQSTEKKKIEQLIKIFDEKYGSHKTENRLVPKYGELGIYVDCRVWDNGYDEIIFFPGFLHEGSSDNLSKYDSSIIKYEVKDGEIEKWKSEALKNKTKEF